MLPTFPQVIDYLRKTDHIGTIGLWGHSMGAATALLHAGRDPSLAGERVCCMRGGIRRWLVIIFRRFQEWVIIFAMDESFARPIPFWYCNPRPEAGIEMGDMRCFFSCGMYASRGLGVKMTRKVVLVQSDATRGRAVGRTDGRASTSTKFAAKSLTPLQNNRF